MIGKDNIMCSYADMRTGRFFEQCGQDAEMLDVRMYKYADVQIFWLIEIILLYTQNLEEWLLIFLAVIYFLLNLSMTTLTVEIDKEKICLCYKLY